ncbi:hypothetical protein, partial [Klebsiella pneumoniae]|uniref:hypothetical protein n=1 Tax=Klebsiella pneumoniae TaxID=573 RepID=UPI001D0E293C
WLMMSLWDALRMNMMISYQELVRTFLSAHSLLCSNVFDEEESKANCVTGGVANVTDGDWLYFLDHYASEKYRRYRYFSQVTACPAILLKISLLIW